MQWAGASPRVRTAIAPLATAEMEVAGAAAQAAVAAAAVPMAATSMKIRYPAQMLSYVGMDKEDVHARHHLPPHPVSVMQHIANPYILPITTFRLGTLTGRDTQAHHRPSHLVTPWRILAQQRCAL